MGEYKQNIFQDKVLSVRTLPTAPLMQSWQCLANTAVGRPQRGVCGSAKSLGLAECDPGVERACPVL